MFTLRNNIFILLIVLMLAGCGTHLPKGPLFLPHQKYDADNALIYFYRTDDENLGYARIYYIKLGEEYIATMKVGGYVPYEVQPGKIMLSSHVIDTAGTTVPLIFYAADLSQREDPAKLGFEAQSGKTYFVRFKPIPDAWTFHPTLNLVSEEEGMAALEATKLIVNHKHKKKDADQ